MTNPNTLVHEVFGWTMRNMPDPEGIMDRADSLAVVDETLPRIYEVKGWDWQNGVASGDALMYHTRATERPQLAVGPFDGTPDDFGEPEEYDEEDDYEREDY